MRKYLKSTLIFIILNFIGLYLGSIWTTPGVVSDWYNNLIQAPWTPPGWVFGAAWTTIGLTFGLAASKFYLEKDHDMVFFFILTWFLNLLWNPIFFTMKAPLLSLIVIMNLSVLIGFMTHEMRVRHGKWVLTMLPYFVWLVIATSLNLFILIMN